jgi:hypothetical protein
MIPIETIAATKGMKSYAAGTVTGMSFRVMVVTADDTEITGVTGKYKGATARAFTVTDFWPSGKKFGKGEYWNFGEDFIITGLVIATAGAINVEHLVSIVPTPAA